MVAPNAKDEPAKAAGAPPPKKAKDQAVNPDDDLSDEDLELKRELEALVARCADAAQPAAVAGAARQLGERIRTATASMTSVPKPLKFLRPHAQDLKARWAALPPEESAADARRALADVISVLASTGAPIGAPGGAARAARLRESLRFKCAGTRDDVGAWGHEYLRHLAGEIASEFAALGEAEAAGKGAAEAEAEAAAADAADLHADEGGGGGDGGGDGQDGKDGKDGKAGADADKNKADAPKPSSGGAAGGGKGGKEGKAGGDKKKGGGGGKKGEAPPPEKMTPEARAVWLAGQRAIRAALPPVTLADIMALVEQVRFLFSSTRRSIAAHYCRGGAPLVRFFSHLAAAPFALGFRRSRSFFFLPVGPPSYFPPSLTSSPPPPFFSSGHHMPNPPTTHTSTRPPSQRRRQNKNTRKQTQTRQKTPQTRNKPPRFKRRSPRSPPTTWPTTPSPRPSTSCWRRSGSTCCRRWWTRPRARARAST